MSHIPKQKLKLFLKQNTQENHSDFIFFKHYLHKTKDKNHTKQVDKTGIIKTKHLLFQRPC